MKRWWKTFKWNLGKFILRIGYKIRGEVPMRNWDKPKKARNYMPPQSPDDLDEMYYIK